MRYEGRTTFGRFVQRLVRRVGRRATSEPGREAAYRLLGLEPGADPRVVRQAFRRLAAANHPDRHVRVGAWERALVMRRFSEITAAYHAIVT
jgi:DnaJ-class molecular chaperone